MHSIRLAITVLVFSLAIRTAHAEVHPVDSTRLVLVGGGPLTGFIETNVGTTLNEATVGRRSDGGGIVGLQIDLPIVRFLTLVGRGSAIVYGDSEGDRLRRTFFDLGVAPTFTFAVDVGRLRLEPRLGVPVGVSIHLANADSTTDFDRLGDRRANAG